MTWRGDYPEDFTTVTIPLTTHAATGAPVAPSSAFETADFKIYKNGNQAEKTSTNGLTIQSPHDSITGLHFLIIDTSNDTGDGGFWVAGAVYDVVLSPDETVDSVAVAKVVGTFGLALAPVFARVGAPAGASVSADVAAIKAVLPAALVGGRIDASVGAVAAGAIAAAAFAANALDAVWSTASRLLTAGTNIVLAKGTGVTGFNDLSAAAVNAEIVDALSVDTYTEPGQGVPLATASLATKISFMAKGQRNKHTQDATTYQLFGDDGVTVDQKATVSDDGTTLTRGELTSGP